MEVVMRMRDLLSGFVVMLSLVMVFIGVGCQSSSTVSTVNSLAGLSDPTLHLSTIQPRNSGFPTKPTLETSLWNLALPKLPDGAKLVLVPIRNDSPYLFKVTLSEAESGGTIHYIISPGQATYLEFLGFSLPGDPDKIACKFKPSYEPTNDDQILISEEHPGEENSEILVIKLRSGATTPPISPKSDRPHLIADSVANTRA
jgi:hypothetical protein